MTQTGLRLTWEDLALHLRSEGRGLLTVDALDCLNLRPPGTPTGGGYFDVLSPAAQDTLIAHPLAPIGTSDYTTGLYEIDAVMGGATTLFPAKVCLITHGGGQESIGGLVVREGVDRFRTRGWIDTARYRDVAIIAMIAGGNNTFRGFLHVRLLTR